MLKKCITNPMSIFPLEGLEVDANLSYEEFPIEILEEQVKMLRNKEVAFIKFLWKNQLVEKATREVEDDMMSQCPDLFSFYSSQG